ncbi:MAG: hypothetical protein GY724_01960 [Actinomycetia bacterium]|nr:hypothetical protein [Actinomycetes bacterium]MCP5031560.1 hypothetical protein [Actinomycetes bacterium]
MAAPDFVPTDPTRLVRTYKSPPRRIEAWYANRPGEVTAGQPRGARLGSIGPDQGYAYSLVSQVEEHLNLGTVSREDAVAGCVAIAMRRASLFGRAPLVHDLTAAFTIYGFFDDEPPAELVELRQGLFAEVRSSHHYAELRHLVDLVREDALRRSPEAIAAEYLTGWRGNLLESSDLETVETGH